jgi:hypothetical protein
VFLDTLSDAALAREVRLARSSVEAASGDSVALFHYPFSRWDERVRAEVAAAGFAGARTIGGINPASRDRYLLQSVAIASDRAGTPERLKELIKETADKSGWLILTYHNVVPQGSAEAKCYERIDAYEPYFVTPATFKSHMKLLASSGFYVGTESDVLTYMLARDNARLSVTDDAGEVNVKVLAASADVKYVARLTLMVELPWKTVGVRVSPGDTGYRVENVVGGVLTLEAAPGSIVSVRRME